MCSRIIRLCCVSLFVASCGIVSFGQKSGDFVPGEVLVKFAAGPLLKSRIRAAHRSIGATVLEELGDSGWQRVGLPAAMSVDEAVKRYDELPGVEFAQPNFYYHLLLQPNDPQYLANMNTSMYGLGKISAPSAWDLSTGSSTVVVADIDTGLRYTHEDIAANAWHNPGEIPNNGVDDDVNGIIDDYYGADFRDNDGDPIDPHGHGTHTAGTIGAVGNNLTGVVGVNWTVKIMSIKIYNAGGTDTTSAMLVNAYNYVRMMKTRAVNPVNIRVTNNSYGGCNEACGYDQATKDGIDAMGDAGILNVFAAGNDNANNDSTPSYPVSYDSPSILGVAASTSTDARASFSSYGVVRVDLAAPGSGVLSTYNSSDSGYATLSGTSMATPHVTGAAALLSAYRPDLSAASLKASLMNNVDVLAAWNGLVKTGGRLNVFKAMQTPTVCTFTPSSPSMTVPTKGGVFTVNITAATNCDYTAKGSAYWIKVLSGNPMSGNGSVTFRVTVNPTVSRTGTVKVGDQTITVTQTRGQ